MNSLLSIGRYPLGRRSTTHRVLAVAILLATLAFPAASGRAALLRLRPQCESSRAVVTLGDLAEISAADPRQAEALAAIELFPAPPAPRQRFVRLREIQDILLLRGVNLAEHQFSGSSRVTVRAGTKPGGDDPNPSAKPVRPLSFYAHRTADRRVSRSVLDYLRGHASADRPWIVKAELDPGLARLAADPACAISVVGGAPPWTGSQRFQVRVNTPDGPVQFPLHAQVTISPALVVTTRSVPRGALIGNTDVELRQTVATQTGSEGFHSLDEVVGKEATRAIPAGKVLQQQSLRSPLLVRRGEVVTVYARSAGICVRTMARSRDNGSLGELILLESLLDRKTFFARVSSVREVEVYARSPKANREKLNAFGPPANRQRGSAARSAYPGARPPLRLKNGIPARNGEVDNGEVDNIPSLPKSHTPVYYPIERKRT